MACTYFTNLTRKKQMKDIFFVYKANSNFFETVFGSKYYNMWLNMKAEEGRIFVLKIIISLYITQFSFI